MRAATGFAAVLRTKRARGAMVRAGRAAMAFMLLGGRRACDRKYGDKRRHKQFRSLEDERYVILVVVVS